MVEPSIGAVVAEATFQDPLQKTFAKLDPEIPVYLVNSTIVMQAFPRKVHWPEVSPLKTKVAKGHQVNVRESVTNNLVRLIHSQRLTRTEAEAVILAAKCMIFVSADSGSYDLREFELSEPADGIWIDLEPII